MRTYAPAPVIKVLDELLEEPSLARGVVHHEVRPARDAVFGDWPGVARPADPRRAREARHRAAVHPPGGGDRGRARRRGRRRRHADRVGQVAVLHGARPPGARRGPVGPGAVPVPDQGARPGPGRRAVGARAGRRARGRRGLLRRRHAGADPVGDPQGRPGRRDQPGHAPLGDPPPPHQVVPAVRAAAGHRRRRAAHVPRRVRQPRRERPAAAAAAVRPLRLQPGRSCAARRRSGTRRSSRSCSRAGRSASIDRNGAPAGEKHLLLVDPPVHRRRRPAPAARR